MPRTCQVHEVKRDRSGAVTEVAKVNLDLKAHSRQVTCLAFSPDCNKAATASKDGTWAVWNLAVRYHMNEDPRKLVQKPQVGRTPGPVTDLVGQLRHGVQ